MTTKAINWGSLKEIPGVSINRFGSLKDDTENRVKFDTNRAFFLTSHDPETLKDVLNKEFIDRLANSEMYTMKLYLQRLSFEYMVEWARSSGDEELKQTTELLVKLTQIGKIVFLRKDRPVQLKFVRNSGSNLIESVMVYTISAGHNPGSVMLLFETLRQQRILFTGNCRLVLNDLKACEALNNPDGGVKSLTSVYVDTTYCVENVQELPARKSVFAQVFQEIKKNIFANPEPRYFEFWSPGRLAHFDNLHFIQAVYYEFRDSVQVNLIPNPELNDEERSHDRCLLRFYEEFDYTNLSDQIRDMKSTDFPYALKEAITEIRMGCDMTEGSVDDVQLFENGLQVYREAENQLRVIYANHLSRYELARMINYLQVDLNNVHPLYLPQGQDLAQTDSLLRSSCANVFGTEPIELSQENPSSAYDLTGGLLFVKPGQNPNPKLETTNLPVYTHRV